MCHLLVRNKLLASVEMVVAVMEEEEVELEELEELEDMLHRTRLARNFHRIA